MWVTVCKLAQLTDKWAHPRTTTLKGLHVYRNETNTQSRRDDILVETRNPPNPPKSRRDDIGKSTNAGGLFHKKNHSFRTYGTKDFSRITSSTDILSLTGLGFYSQLIFFVLKLERGLKRIFFESQSFTMLNDVSQSEKIVTLWNFFNFELLCAPNKPRMRECIKNGLVTRHEGL